MKIFLAAALLAGHALAQTSPEASQSGPIIPPLASLCASLQGITREPAVASAHWGLSVATLEGQPLCAVNATQLFRPASNNKIFTTATAIALLGPQANFTTRIDAEGSIAAGSLTGDLVLVGAGDPGFGSPGIPWLPPARRPHSPVPEPAAIPDVEDLAAQVAATGLRSITGDLIGDDTFFAHEPYPDDWAADDLLWGYGAPVSALSIHDNQLDLNVSPGTSHAASPAVTVSTTPAVAYYTLDVHALTANPAGKPRDCGTLGYERGVFSGSPASRTVTIYGSLPPSASPNPTPCTETLAIDDPATYAALALREALSRRGITVAGATRARHAPLERTGPTLHRPEPQVEVLLPGILRQDSGPLARIACNAQTVYTGAPEVPHTTLATHTSHPLLDDLLYTNKESQNLHAEVLLRDLGAAFSCEHTQSTGAAVIRQYLLHAGLDPRDTWLVDGSGLSGHDLVAPRALTRFLVFAATQPWFAAWKATLPEGGVDGTLASRFSTLKGRLFAKTGTLGESRALSGYVTTAGGRTLVFSVMVDNHVPGNGNPDRAAMDRIVNRIAAEP